jgi:hypothetical protein
MGNSRMGRSPMAVITITEGRAKKSLLKSIAKELTRQLLNAPAVSLIAGLAFFVWLSWMKGGDKSAHLINCPCGLLLFLTCSSI